MDAGFWWQDPLALEAAYRQLAADLPGGPIKSASPVYVRDLGIEVPSGHLVTGHIIATDPRGQSLLPKSASATASTRRSHERRGRCLSRHSRFCRVQG